MGNNMSWEENVRKVVPYVAGEQPKDTDVIKLNTNECPYPPAPGVEKRAKELCVDRLRLYPNMDAAELVAAIADYYNVKESEVFVGVGSDDVLGMAFMTFFNSANPILFPDITYSFYDVWAELFKIPYETCALDEAFRIRKEDYFRPNGGIIIPNPNAPTAIFEDCSVLEEIVAGNPGSVVIIDEAYVDFGAESMLPLIHKYDNLMVVQTFSKSRAMAGMRIGFAIASEKLIGYLKDVKFSYNSYTMNLPAIELGVEAVKDREYFENTVRRIIETREWTKVQLKNLGFTFTDSKSNFLFAAHEKVPAQQIFDEKLSVRDVEKLVKNLHKPAKPKKTDDKTMQVIYQDIEEKLKQKLGRKVTVTSRGEGSGKIEIEFYNHEDLDRLLDVLNK